MISLVVVNYRSAALAAEAVRSARAASSQPVEVIIVDNSCDAAQAELLRPHADFLITAESNLGYAGGINRGRGACHGEVMIVANPDIAFHHGAIDELLTAMKDSSAAVAGPALFWDDASQWRLPPSDLFTAAQKVDEALATRIGAWEQWRDRRRFDARVRFWSLSAPAAVDAISGAVMAIRADVFDAAGGFDERFALYFEENDFLRRVAKRGETILYVPASSCRHIYNQSAGDEPTRTAGLYLESERRYLEKWNGRLSARALKAIERPPRPHPAANITGAFPVPPGAVVEASPLASFATAAGHFPSSDWVTLPEEVWTAYRADRLYLRVVDRATGRVSRTYVRSRVD